MNETSIATELTTSQAIEKIKSELEQSKTQLKTLQEDSKASKVPVWWTPASAMTVSCSLLIFGLIVMILITRTIKNHQINEMEARLYTISLIVFSSVFLIVAGYSDTQITPVMTLLGTIVGYIVRDHQIVSQNGNNGIQYENKDLKNGKEPPKP